VYSRVKYYEPPYTFQYTTIGFVTILNIFVLLFEGSAGLFNLDPNKSSLLSVNWLLIKPLHFVDSFGIYRGNINTRIREPVLRSLHIAS